MNHSSDHAESLEAIADSLQQLQPVADRSDPSELFYRAGFAAGRAQAIGTARRRHVIQFAAAAAVACAIVAPASYQLGQNSGAQAVAEAKSAVKVPERSETSSETSGAERARPEPPPPASDDAEPTPVIIEATRDVPAIAETIAAESSGADFWRRWIQLEAILRGRQTEPPAAHQPFGHVLTASHSPESLQQWLEDRESLSPSGRSESDHPERNESKTSAAPKASTLSVGDAKRWGEITQDLRKEQR